MGAALTDAAGGDHKEASSSSSRANILQHLEKYSETYKPSWDGLDPAGKMREGYSFESYLKEMANHTIHGWGGP